MRPLQQRLLRPHFSGPAFEMCAQSGKRAGTVQPALHRVGGAPPRHRAAAGDDDTIANPAPSITGVRELLAERDIAEMPQPNVFAPPFLLQAHLLCSGKPFEVVNHYMRPACFKCKIEVGR